jgi:PAS domain-containing protein
MAAQWETARRTGQAFEVEYRWRRGDGVYRWFKASVIDVRGPDGNIVRWYGDSIDIHDSSGAGECGPPQG